MKNLARFFSFACALLLATPSHASTSTAVEVIAKEKASGKVVYHGQTGADGKFATGSLAPGSYIFEFSSKDGSGFQVALAGPKSARQVKSSGASLAFAVEVAPAAKVSGQVTSAAAVAAQAGAGSNANVKIINGKRYVFVRGEIGSNLRGQWVPEEDARVANPNAARKSASEFLRDAQDMGGQGSTIGR